MFRIGSAGIQFLCTGNLGAVFEKLKGEETMERKLQDFVGLHGSITQGRHRH
jgi:hypothetical protein